MYIYGNRSCSPECFLQTVPLNLGTVVIGAFYGDKVKKVLKMSDREQPLYIMPVGRIK